MFERMSYLSCISMVSILTATVIAMPNALARDYGKWQKNPVQLPAPVNGASADGCNYISRDGLALYFASVRAGGSGVNDIWVATRTSINESFSNVTVLTNVNSAGQDQCPAITDDGQWLYFVSNRTGGCGDLDLYVAARAGVSPADWGAPINMGCAVNSVKAEEGPALYTDILGGTQVYFSSNRTGTVGGFDIFSMTVDTSSDGLATLLPAAVPGVNTTDNDRRPTIRYDGLEMIFETNRSGSQYGGHNLWSATRASVLDDFGLTVPEDRINSDEEEARPSLNGDGTELYFTSNRTGSLGNNNDIYQTQRDFGDQQ